MVEELKVGTDENIVKVLNIPGYKLYSGGWRAQGWNGWEYCQGSRIPGCKLYSGGWRAQGWNGWEYCQGSRISGYKLYSGGWRAQGFGTEKNIVKVLNIPGYKLYLGGWRAQGWNEWEYCQGSRISGYKLYRCSR